MHHLEVPDDLARRRAERHHRVGVGVRAEPLAAVIVRARAARRGEDEAALDVDRHHRPHVGGAVAAPALTLPGGGGGIGRARRDGVPGPAQRAGARVVGAHHPALDLHGTVVADGRADHHEPVHNGRRRRHLIARTIAGCWGRRRMHRREARAEGDAVGEVHLAAAAEIRARQARGRIERDETGVDGPDEDAPTARASGLGGGVEPGRDAA